MMDEGGGARAGEEARDSGALAVAGEEEQTGESAEAAAEGEERTRGSSEAVENQASKEEQADEENGSQTDEPSLLGAAGLGGVMGKVIGSFVGHPEKGDQAEHPPTEGEFP
jgi:hypothetical protein